MIQTSTSLKYEPSLELLRITAKQLFLPPGVGDSDGAGGFSRRCHLKENVEPLPTSVSNSGQDLDFDERLPLGRVTVPGSAHVGAVLS